MKRKGEYVTGATHTAEAEGNNGGMQSAYGKFKDLETLLRAYDSLEAEFTRRSQKLKELERETGNRGKREVAPENPQGERDALETFLNEFPRAKAYREKLTAAAVNGEAENAERTYIGILENEILKSESKLSDRDFLLSAVSADPTISGEIVNAYLKRLINSKPQTVFGGGNALVAPPRRPNDLKEAASMAENYLKTKIPIKIG